MHQRAVGLVGSIVLAVALGATPAWAAPPRPPATQLPTILPAGSAPNDAFGLSMAVAGRTLFVGAPGHNVGANNSQGAVYIFGRSGSSWVQQSTLLAPDGAALDQFGWHVTVSRTTLLVSARTRSLNGQFGVGAVYVFVRRGTTWAYQATLTPPAANNDSGFGMWSAISGNTVVIGSPGSTLGGNLGVGRVYVFSRTGTAWTQRAVFEAPDGASGDEFGASVAFAGTTIVVGAPWHDSSTEVDDGVVYFFVPNATGYSMALEMGPPSDSGQWLSMFGLSIAATPTSLFIGSPGRTIGSGPHAAGAVYEYSGSGSTWAPQSEITANDPTSDAVFGSMVVYTGRQLVVGAPNATVGTTAGQGAAYVMTKSGSSWSVKAKLTDAAGAAYDEAGWPVAASGKTVFVGAPTPVVLGLPGTLPGKVLVFKLR
jgi:hypothetical protein